MLRFLPALFLAIPLTAQLSPDGLGWGRVRLGTDYETVKKSLQGEGWNLKYKIGEGPGEDTTYGKRFEAKPAAKTHTTIQEYRVFSEFWRGTIWDFTVLLKGIDPKGIRADLTRILGQPEIMDEYNARWESPKAYILGFFMGNTARLHFFDLDVQARIEKQQLVDQGIEPGEPSGRGPLRRPTPAEAAWIASFMATVRDALPPAPEGFEVDEQTDSVEPKLIENPKGTCPHKREYLVRYIHRQRQEAGGQALRATAEASRDSQQAKIDQTRTKLQRQMDLLQQQASDASAKGDMAAVQRIQQEVSRLAADGDAAMKDAETAFRTSLKDGKLKDVRLSVRVAINGGEALVRGLTSTKKVAGHPTYYRLTTADDSVEEESETVVLLGAWKTAEPDSEHQMAARWNSGLSNITGQNLQVQVRGDATRTRAYLEAIRWDKLVGLLKI